MNPYKILGIKEDATRDEIKSAYRTMAAKYHPDRGGDTWIFQQIQDAYSELTDQKKKARKSETPTAGTQPKKETREDPFGFEVPPNPQPDSAPQYTNRRHSRHSRKNRSKRKNENALVFWIVGGVVATVVVVLGSLGLWFSLRSISRNNAVSVKNVSIQEPSAPLRAHENSTEVKGSNDKAKKKTLVPNVAEKSSQERVKEVGNIRIKDLPGREVESTRSASTLDPVPADRDSTSGSQSRKPTIGRASNDELPKVDSEIVKFGGHSYRFVNESVQCEVARAKCEQLGGYLARIESKKEFEFLKNAAEQSGGTRFWIDGIRKLGEKHWRYESGGFFLRYLWAEGEPNLPEGKTGYVVIWRDGDWMAADEKGSSHYAYICEWDR